MKKWHSLSRSNTTTRTLFCTLSPTVKTPVAWPPHHQRTCGFGICMCIRRAPYVCAFQLRIRLASAADFDIPYHSLALGRSCGTILSTRWSIMHVSFVHIPHPGRPLCKARTAEVSCICLVSFTMGSSASDTSFQTTVLLPCATTSRRHDSSLRDDPAPSSALADSSTHPLNCFFLCAFKCQYGAPEYGVGHARFLVRCMDGSLMGECVFVLACVRNSFLWYVCVPVAAVYSVLRTRLPV